MVNCDKFKESQKKILEYFDNPERFIINNRVNNKKLADNFGNSFNWSLIEILQEILLESEEDIKQNLDHLHEKGYINVSKESRDVGLTLDGLKEVRITFSGKEYFKKML